MRNSFIIHTSSFLNIQANPVQFIPLLQKILSLVCGVRIVHPWQDYRGVGEEQLHPPHFLVLERPGESPPIPLLQRLQLHKVVSTASSGSPARGSCMTDWEESVKRSSLSSLPPCSLISKSTIINTTSGVIFCKILLLQ